MVNDSHTIEELKNIVKTFCEERDWDQFHDPKEISIGIVTEAAELLDIFRFKSKNEMQELFKDEKRKSDIEDELADTFYFLIRFAQLNNISLGEALINKIKKNEEKYPLNKSKGSNKKYTEY